MDVFEIVQSLQFQPQPRLRWAEDVHGKRVLQQEYLATTKIESEWREVREWRAIPVEYVY